MSCIEGPSGCNVESDHRDTVGAGDQLGSCPFRSGRKGGGPDRRRQWGEVERAALGHDELHEGGEAFVRKRRQGKLPVVWLDRVPPC